MFNNVLLSIDELFDVRTGVWTSIVTQPQFDEMLAEGFGIRKSDRWDRYVPYTTYLEAYKQRDINTLKNSTISSIIPMLDEVLLQLANQSHTNPTMRVPVLYVDFPQRYVLDADEINAICGMLSEQLQTSTPIKVLRSKGAYTPLDFKKLEIGVVFVYDVVQWMESVAMSNVIDINMTSPQTQVVCALVHTSDQTYVQDKLVKAGEHVKEILRPCVQITYVSSALFTSPLLVEMYHSSSSSPT